MKKDFLSITDLTKEEILTVLLLAKEEKGKYIQAGESKQIFKNKTLAMIFEKPSLRTRLSFEVAMTQLGGHAIYLGSNDIQMGTREPIKDIAKVVSSMADIIMARTFHHETIVELAIYASIPVINGLSDIEHPCQILADLLTIFEYKKTFKNIKLAFIGDGDNNVAHSLALAAALLGMHFVCASPKEYWMKKDIFAKAKNIAQGTKAIIEQTIYPKDAAKDADIIYTDTWISMGDEMEKQKRLEIFTSYQANQKLMTYAKPDAIFMHDMPAYRGNEVTSGVIDGKKSVVYQQAENRLHAQKALLLFLKDFLDKTYVAKV